jgi:hypothetical protein
MKKLSFLLGIFLPLGLMGQSLVSSTLLGTKTQAQLLQQFDNLPFIQHGVRYYRITYTSTNVQNNLDTVSGLLVLPNNPNKIYPRLVYQHGTSGNKLDVPSFTVNSGGEGELGLLFGGLGYVALLPDYLGLGVSDGFHPYVHAATEASVALDMLEASAQFAEDNAVQLNAQLFITGYSQGGHAAMALHRAIEKDPESPYAVTAAAPLSGPYSISGVMRDLILADAVYFYPAYIPNTALSYQTVYGNIFNSVGDMFKAPYAAYIQSFYTGQTSLSNLNTQLVSALIVNEGSCRPIKMLQDSILEAIQENPDHPINLALADNDTYNNWTPEAPMRLFYCMADDQVPFQNSVVARDTLTAAGAPNFSAMDVGPTFDHGQCFTPAMTNTLLFFLGFQQIGTVSTEGPAAEATALLLSPNPASTQVTVCGLPGKGRLEIVDFNGKLLLSERVTGETATLYLGELPEGIYLVRCSDGRKEMSAERLVVKR